MYHYQPHHESYYHHQPSSYHYEPYYPHHEHHYEHPKYHHEHPKYHHEEYHHHEEEKHGYGHPSYHKEEEKHGLSTVGSLLVPLLGLIGLSLLVPNVVGLRAKRDVEYDLDPGDKQAQVLAAIYNTLLRSDHCIRRLLCEMGQLGKNAKDKDGLFKLIDRMFPKQFQEEVSIFKEASMAATYTCTKYTCQVKPTSNSTNDASEVKT